MSLISLLNKLKILQKKNLKITLFFFTYLENKLNQNELLSTWAPTFMSGLL